MKKSIILTVCLLLASVGIYADTMAKCFLQHEGTITVFEKDNITDAIDAAVKGDTLFLTEGTFPAFTLNKEITVRGAGQNTRTNGPVTIALPTSSKINQTLLEALFINGNVKLTTAMDGVKIKQCVVSGSFDTSSNCDNIIIDRCSIEAYLYQRTNIKGMTVMNSYIWIIYNVSESSLTDNSPFNFINCTFSYYNINSSNYGGIGNFINCLFYSANYNYTSYKSISNSTLVNCLIGWEYGNNNSTFQNCYKSTSSIAETVDWLKSNNYLGNDGTVVGRYGGSNPFTLEPSFPKVTDSKIAVDPEKKILNVSLKVSAK